MFKITLKDKVKEAIEDLKDITKIIGLDEESKTIYLINDQTQIELRELESLKLIKILTPGK